MALSGGEAVEVGQGWIDEDTLDGTAGYGVMMKETQVRPSGQPGCSRATGRWPTTYQYLSIHIQVKFASMVHDLMYLSCLD